MFIRLLMFILAIFFPWLVLLIYTNLGPALVAFIMQATIIGWIPATIWAWQSIPSAKKKKTKEKE
jgi:hypothetical protein